MHLDPIIPASFVPSEELATGLILLPVNTVRSTQVVPESIDVYKSPVPTQATSFVPSEELVMLDQLRLPDAVCAVQILVRSTVPTLALSDVSDALTVMALSPL
jgi:hypothetical protein